MFARIVVGVLIGVVAGIFINSKLPIEPKTMQIIKYLLLSSPSHLLLLRLSLAPYMASWLLQKSLEATSPVLSCFTARALSTRRLVP